MEHNLRGYGFEYIAKILLRRKQKNNFIFQSCLFDGFEEILKKYRLIETTKNETKIKFLKNNWNKCDLIEIILNNKKERKIRDIILYDVKTKHMNAKKDYFEVCESNYDAMKKAMKLDFELYFVSIIMFENWKFSLNCIPFERSRIRKFTNFNKN